MQLRPDQPLYRITCDRPVDDRCQPGEEIAHPGPFPMSGRGLLFRLCRRAVGFNYRDQAGSRKKGQRRGIVDPGRLQGSGRQKRSHIRQGVPLIPEALRIQIVAGVPGPEREAANDKRQKQRPPAQGSTTSRTKQLLPRSSPRLPARRRFVSITGGDEPHLPCQQSTKIATKRGLVQRPQANAADVQPLRLNEPEGSE